MEGVRKEWAGKIFGGIAPGALGRGLKTKYITRRFGLFPYTDFHQTWHEHLNLCVDELYQKAEF